VSWGLSRVSAAYLQYSLDCSMCIQRKPGPRLSKLKRKRERKASIRQLWYCRDRQLTVVTFESDVQVNVFLLRDDREAEHLLISVIRERLSSPAGEAIHGRRKEPSFKRPRRVARRWADIDG